MSYPRETVELVISELGLRLSRPDSAGWADGLCPIHEERNPSFSINVLHGGWVCRSQCGSGGLADLVALVTGDPIEAVRSRLRRRSVSLELSLSQALIARRRDRTAGDDGGEPLFYERGRVPRYLVDRGFTLETLRRWEVGYDPELRAAVIPVRSGGRIVGLIRRLVDPGSGPKYLYSRGLRRDETLFGDWMIPADARRVVVVEGPLDAMWLDQHGHRGVAILGSLLSARQADLILRRFWEVVLALDPDPAGERGIRLALRRLSRARVLVARLPAGRDVQECSPEELDQAIRSAVPPWAAG